MYAFACVKDEDDQDSEDGEEGEAADCAACDGTRWGVGGGFSLRREIVEERDAVDGGSNLVQPGSSRGICSAYAALTPAKLAENIR